MKNHGTPHSTSTVIGFLRDPVALVRALFLPPRLTPVPIPVRRGLGPTRWRSSSRRTGWPALLVGFVLLAAGPVLAAPPDLPAAVPNIYDPEVLAHFQPVALATLRGNPDFPVILLANTTGEQPQVLLLGFDARNGKDTWSLTEDPIILIAILSDEITIQGVYVDTGFLDGGRASGNYVAVNEEESFKLSELLNAVTVEKTRTSI